MNNGKMIAGKRRKSGLDVYREKAEAYFAACDALNAAASGNKIPKPYTLSGLLCELSLTREQFKSLAKSRKGRAFVTWAMLKIETFIEENALSGSIAATAAANSLKYNFGWNEKPEEETDRSVLVTLAGEAEKLGE